jgi:carbamoyltransferase
MAAVLGVSCHYHDAAAALVVDGAIVAAAQEERFSRIRFDPSIPTQAMQWCLKQAGMVSGDLDRVVFYENPYAHQARIMQWSLKTWPRGLRMFPKAMAAQLGNKLWVLDRLSKTLNVKRDRVSHVDHHRSHAASAFYCSPFAKAGVLTLDGVGDSETTTIAIGEEKSITKVWALEFPHSIGLLYAAITAWLGFRVNDGEYKVMGLAAYGTDRFRQELEKVLCVAGPTGPNAMSMNGFSLDVSYLGHLVNPELGFGPKLETLLGPRRPRAKPWDLTDNEDRRYADIAASLQSLTEEIVVQLARKARATSGVAELCMAGGVALNCVANALVAKEGPLYVHPAAGDAGGALGAAIIGSMELGDPRPPYLQSVALGPVADSGRAIAIAKHLGFATKLVDPVEEASIRIGRGEVIGWVQGRTEWGPRALGYRSILADPAQPDVKNRVNQSVKQREMFRPFAPVVRSSDMHTYFEGEADLLTPFMCTVRTVRSDRDLPAVTHVDGSARVQTVDDGPLMPLLEKHSVLLNTSLNAAGDPIVSSETDALSFLLARPIDALLLNDVLVTKP